MVSDDGAAFMEVLSGAFSETVFRRLAREKCERYGAAFDGGTMLYLRVSKDKLRGAIVAMANLMREVVDDTIHRSVDSRAHQIDQELWHKLDAAFGAGSVERKVQLSGESTAVHEFKALVKTEKGYVAFDTFSSQGHSVNSIYVKMSDLNRRHDAPRGVAVTRDLGSVGPKLHLISSVARVVEIGIGPELFHRLAEAA